MAFTFLAETGDADPASNSYTTVSFADDYISTNSFSVAKWDALLTADKEKLLSRVSKYFDKIVDWNGDRVEQDSGMRWPRANVYDNDGFLIADDSIPIALQEAVCEFAPYLIDEDWTTPQGQRGFKQIKVDVIGLEIEPGYVRPSLPDIVIDMLSPLGEVNRGSRPSFKKIIRA